MSNYEKRLSSDGKEFDRELYFTVRGLVSDAINRMTEALRFNKWFASHPENYNLAKRAAEIASERGYGLRHNVTSLGKHDGYHRYVILSDKNGHYDIRSKNVLVYFEDRYSRNYLPSKSGEASSIRAVISWLESHDAKTSNS